MTIDEITQLGQDYEVCPCMANTLGEIIEAIKNGNDTIDALMDSIDVGTACELCHSAEIDEDEEREVHLDEIIAYVKASH
jgi:NAD(P)H-nitrite reductase large subunit